MWTHRRRWLFDDGWLPGHRQESVSWSLCGSYCRWWPEHAGFCCTRHRAVQRLSAVENRLSELPGKLDVRRTDLGKGKPRFIILVAKKCSRVGVWAVTLCQLEANCINVPSEIAAAFQLLLVFQDGNYSFSLQKCLSCEQRPVSFLTLLQNTLRMQLNVAMQRYYKVESTSNFCRICPVCSR